MSEARYCPRCMLLYRMRMEPDKTWMIVLPPHDPECPVIAQFKPAPLPPRSTS